MKYRPSNKIKIAPSQIEGLGAFATEDIPKGTDLGCTHMDDPDGDEMKRIEWGAYINHGGEDANLELKKVKEIVIYPEEEMNGNNMPALDFKTIRYYNAFALRDIKAGEELTSDYGADGENNCPCGLDYVDELN